MMGGTRTSPAACASAYAAFSWSAQLRCAPAAAACSCFATACRAWS